MWRSSRLLPLILGMALLLLMLLLVGWTLLHGWHATSRALEAGPQGLSGELSTVRGYLAAGLLLVFLMFVLGGTLLVRAFMLWRQLVRASNIRRESHRRYRFLAEGPPSIGIVRISLEDYTVLDLNRAAMKLFGRSRAEVVGEKAWFSVDPEEQEGFRERLSRLSPDGAQLVVPVTAAPGETRYMEWHISGVAWEGESASEAVAVVTDATEAMRAEWEKREKERLQGVLEMAGAAAHELNQPIQVLAGFMDLMMAKITPEDPLYPKLSAMRASVDKITRIGRKIATVRHYKVKTYLGDDKIIDLDRAADSSLHSRGNGPGAIGEARPGG